MDPTSSENNLPQWASALPLQPITLTPLTPVDVRFVDALCDEQIAQMEGQTREAVRARLEALHQVQTQLAGILTQLTQIYVLMPDERNVPQNNNA